MYLKSPLPTASSDVRAARRPSGGRALGVMSIVLAVAGFTVTACAESPSGRTTGLPSASISTPVSEGSSTGGAVDPAGSGGRESAEELSARMTAAMAASGGCRVRATLGTASLTGVFVLGQKLTRSMIADVRAQGQLTLGDGRSARFVAILGNQPENTIYVNDGTLVDGRAWAELPEMGMDIKHPEALLQTHLPYLAAAQAVLPVNPQAAAILPIDPVRTVGSETIEGVSATHYSWGVDGQPDVEVWLDDKSRPVRFVSHRDQAPTSTTTYDRWGRQPAIVPPAEADTTVLR